MDSLLTYLPKEDGLLPKFLLFLSIVSIGNSVQAYLSLAPTQGVYTGPTTDLKNSPVTALSARTFGTWTCISSIVRLYAAYNITNKAVYELGMWTAIIAAFHFYSEWLVFGTTRWSKGLAGPAIISLSTIVWMASQKEYYVK